MRNRTNPLLVFLLIILVITNTWAQTGEEEKDCRVCKSGVHQNGSPYHTDFKGEVPFIITSSASLAFGLVSNLTDKTVPYTEDELSQLDRNDVNAFDRPATYNWNPNAARASDFIRTSVIILPIIFLGNHHTRKDIGPLLIMTLEVTAITYGLTAGIKHIVNRTRPLVYNEEAPLEERTAKNSRLSFFSGHTSFTAAFSFFFAKVMTDYHPDMKIEYKICLWAFATAIPAVTAYLRVEAGKHFPTDVMTGYAVGATIGWLVPHLHKKKVIPEGMSISPSFSYGSRGIYLSYRF
jgi:membrane-associated phospholipid phosphatase